jgi:hypothetical protein
MGSIADFSLFTEEEATLMRVAFNQACEAIAHRVTSLPQSEAEQIVESLGCKIIHLMGQGPADVDFLRDESLRQLDLLPVKMARSAVQGAAHAAC